MSSKEQRLARQVAEALAVNYTAALRYVRSVTGQHGKMDMPDLALACREMMEKERNND